MTSEEYSSFLEKQTVKYSNDIVDWRNRLMKNKDLKIKFDYFDNSLRKTNSTNKEVYYRTHSGNVMTFFKRLCRDNEDKNYINMIVMIRYFIMNIHGSIIVKIVV